MGILNGLLQAVGSGVHMDNHGYTPLHWACFNGTCTEFSGLSCAMLHGCACFNGTYTEFSGLYHVPCYMVVLVKVVVSVLNSDVSCVLFSLQVMTRV